MSSSDRKLVPGRSYVAALSPPAGEEPLPGSAMPSEQWKNKRASTRYANDRPFKRQRRWCEDVESRSLANGIETDAHRIAQRQKQIDFGKNTLAYDRFIAICPRHNRQYGDPMTPLPHQKCSKRSFSGQITSWKIKVYEYVANLEQKTDTDQLSKPVEAIKLNDFSSSGSSQLPGSAPLPSVSQMQRCHKNSDSTFEQNVKSPTAEINGDENRLKQTSTPENLDQKEAIHEASHDEAPNGEGIDKTLFRNNAHDEDRAKGDNSGSASLGRPICESNIKDGETSPIEACNPGSPSVIASDEGSPGSASHHPVVQPSSTDRDMMDVDIFDYSDMEDIELDDHGNVISQTLEPQTSRSSDVDESAKRDCADTKESAELSIFTAL